jgi:hypothetical protein
VSAGSTNVTFAGAAGTVKLQACARVTNWANTKPIVTSPATHRRCRRTIISPARALATRDINATVYDVPKQAGALMWINRFAGIGCRPSGWVLDDPGR